MVEFCNLTCKFCDFLFLWKNKLKLRKFQKIFTKEIDSTQSQINADFLHFHWLEKLILQRNISLRMKVGMISTFSPRNISVQRIIRLVEIRLKTQIAKK